MPATTATTSAIKSLRRPQPSARSDTYDAGSRRAVQNARAQVGVRYLGETVLGGVIFLCADLRGQDGHLRLLESRVQWPSSYRLAAPPARGVAGHALEGEGAQRDGVRETDGRE